MSKHILVVESDPDDAFLIRLAFKSFPFCTSFLCRSVSEAQAYLAGTGIFADRENFPVPDAILTELRLGPDLAYELIAWVRGVKSLQLIPVYVLASAVSPRDEATLRAVNVKAVTVKPADGKELEKTLEAISKEICGS